MCRNALKTMFSEMSNVPATSPIQITVHTVCVRRVLMAAIPELAVFANRTPDSY
jgi:hypothetical protein